MRPEWQWTGSEDSKAGVARYEVETSWMNIDLPDFSTAQSLAKLIERAYDSGKRAGYQSAKWQVESALAEAARRLA